MNEFEEQFKEYFSTIKDPVKQDKFRKILIKIFLMLDENAYPKINKKLPSFFLNNELVVSFKATPDYFEISPDVVKIAWNDEIDLKKIEKIIKDKEANILNNVEGIDHAED